MSDIVGADSAKVDDAAEKDIVAYPLLYYIGLILVAAAWATLGLVLGALVHDIAGYAIWIVGFLHFAFGFYVVSAEEIGGIYFLGIPTIEVSGFPVIVLLGFCRLTTYTLKIFEVRVPTDPEKVYRSHDKTTNIPEHLLKQGFRPPIRVPFAKKRKDGKAIDPDDPLEKRSTNEVSFYARLQIQNFFNFDIRIGSMEEAENQVEGIGVNFVNAELVQMTPAEALERQEMNSNELKATMLWETRHWGVKVITAKIRQIEFSRSLNVGLEAVPEAQAALQKTTFDAEGKKRTLALEGEGTAAAELADLTARTAGLKNMQTTLGVPMETILAAETARTIAEGNNEKIILPGFEGLASVVGAISKGFQHTKPPTDGGVT